MRDDAPSQPARRGLLAAGLGAMALAAPPRAVAAVELTAQTTEGPYYLESMPLRADITEGLAGVALEVRLQVVQVVGAAQQPLSDCRVDLWQCDAQGLYSGFAGQGDGGTTTTAGKTFLRGSLLTAADGLAAFKSIYPGWYAGRTTHIHFKVWRGRQAVLTTQFFLPDALSEYLYTALPGYQRQALRGVLNSTDGIALMAGGTTIGTVREEADRYVASLTAVVDPLAQPMVWRPGGGPPPESMRMRGGGPPPGFGGTPALPTPQGAARVQALVPGRR